MAQVLARKQYCLPWLYLLCVQVLARKLRMVGIDTAVAGQVLRSTYS